MIILTTIIVVIDLFFAVLIFIPKRVVLTNDKICIYRFCFPLQVTFWDIRGFNDKILYSEITSCKYVDEIYLGARKPFLLVNNNSLVEIKTKNHKQYLVPLKNYESFICEVNKKIYENKKSDSVNAEHTVDSSLIDKTKNI
jgi:hypothetical protein